MRRILTTALLVLLSCVAFAQSIDNTLKFLGIPVDGTKEYMIRCLQDKGFRYNSVQGYLSGQFNGENVEVYIHTNHNLVDRVYVSFPSTTSEAQIKNRFNRLISQFDNNNKYMSLLGNDPIPSDENISTQMIVHDKHYQASYRYFNPDMAPEDIANLLLDKMTASMSEEDAAKYRELMNVFMSSSKEEQDEFIGKAVENLSESEATPESLMSMMKLLETFESVSTGEVWFTIHKHGGQYNIGLYYDNLANRANGEDL